MIKVITYGTYDHLHYGHIRLLQRARELGDFLIVGVTAENFDMMRGKINVQQSLEERVAAIQATGIADKVIIEEYEGQKIDDIRRYGVDIFTVGSDWEGYFDYLKDYCKVVYLPRTEGISSSEIRSERSSVKLGIVGYSPFLRKVFNESQYVNSVDIVGICVPQKGVLNELEDSMSIYTTDYEELLENVDAVYLHSHPQFHYKEAKMALLKGKHVLCESPIALNMSQYNELMQIAENKGTILMEAIRTGYTTAYARMLLLLKSGKIGKVVSVDATCTSLISEEGVGQNKKWGALEAWGPTTLLPVLQILGPQYERMDFFSLKNDNLDLYTRIDFRYQEAIASIRVGTGVKSEGEMVVSGTKGYVYVPAPWWKTEYFELRYENPADNRRYFYQLDGDGIRKEMVELVKAIKTKMPDFYITRDVSENIVKIMEKYQRKN